MVYLSVKPITTPGTESLEEGGQIMDQMLGQSVVRPAVILLILALQVSNKGT